MTIPGQAMKTTNKTLWCVSVQGPDDIIAAPDYLTAVRMANAFNDWLLNLKTKQPHDDAIHARMWAVPIEWPRDNAQGHADELSKPHPEYQWLRDALTAAAPYMSGVKVKQLDWIKVGDEHYAKTPFGTYRLDRLKALSFGGHSLSRPYLILDEAKDAAQANYEKRILSTLEPSSARERVLDEVFQILRQYSDHPSEVVSFVMTEIWDAVRALKSRPPQTGGGE